MKVLVTGAAGFIGSHLVEKLVSDGHQVVALDCFLNESYSSKIKRDRIHDFSREKNIIFKELDLREKLPNNLLDGIDAIINEAGMPGLMQSWENFRLYAECNLIGVENLARLSIAAGNIPIIQISTSSVYGSTATRDEESDLFPISPYGVSKLAAENLLQSFGRTFNLPFTILRYFSVYGPRQRPDMAFHIIAESILRNREIPIFGNGLQSRPNTFVTDAVNATLLALDYPNTQQAFNITGFETMTLLDAIGVLENVLEKKARLMFDESRPGDQDHTAVSFEKARNLFGYNPQVGMLEGLKLQAEWHRYEMKRD